MHYCKTCCNNTLKFIDVNYFFLYTTIQIFFLLKRDVAMKGRNPWLYVSAPETYAGPAGIAGGSGVAAAPTSGLP